MRTWFISPDNDGARDVVVNGFPRLPGHDKYAAEEPERGNPMPIFASVRPADLAKVIRAPLASVTLIARIAFPSVPWSDEHSIRTA